MNCDRVCSTPFGITACVTEELLLAKGAHDSAQRLSASLLASPPSPRRASPPPTSAQRLSASLLASPQRSLTMPPAVTKCAQRLSASLLASPAEREHGGRRDGGAQRLSASLLASPTENFGGTAVTYKCSTPFGITACVTNCFSSRPARWRTVLNAFRHHCLRHRGPGKVAFQLELRLPSSSTSFL